MKKNILNEFNVGFEFEFFIKNKSLFTAKENIPKEILEKYYSFFDEKKINNYSIEDCFNFVVKKIGTSKNWVDILKAKEDGSLEYMNGYTSVEIVTKPLPGEEAFIVLKDFLNLLKQKDFKTTKSCGLHVNISFKESNIDYSNFAFHLSSSVDFERLLKPFGRLGNDYCLPNNTKDYDIDFDDLTNSLQRFLDKQIQQKSVLSFIKNINNANTNAEFLNLVGVFLKKQIISDWLDDRPAIAPRIQKNNEYLEFRSMGGLGYEKKQEVIIDNFLYIINEMKKLKLSKNQKIKEDIYKPSKPMSVKTRKL